MQDTRSWRDLPLQRDAVSVSLTVKHILINSDSFGQIRQKHYQTNNLKTSSKTPNQKK